MSKAFIDFLESIVAAENILLEEPMHQHTTFRMSSPAEVFVTVENKEQLEKIIKYLNLVERPYFILGNGSNLLVGDKGYRGVIIHLGGEFNILKTEGTLLTAGASVLLSAAAREAMENGLTGMEFASGIPEASGGSVKMNAGAYMTGKCGRSWNPCRSCIRTEASWIWIMKPWSSDTATA